MHASFVTLCLERPPRMRLYFDLVLHNERAEPRWHLLPYELGSTSVPTDVAVDTVEVYRLGREKEVTVGHFGGEGGFWALLLPPGARIALRRFPFLLRGEVPESVTIVVVVVRQLRIGDTPTEDWFDVDPLSAGRAEVDAGELADQSRVCYAKAAPEGQRLSVTCVIEDRIEQQVPVDL